MGKDLRGKEIGRGLSQRKDGRYEGKYVDRDGKRKSIYGFKLTEVRNRLADINYEVRNGTALVDPGLTVAIWYQKWIESYKTGKVADSTLSNYKHVSKFILDSIGSMKLSEVKPVNIQDIINAMNEKGYSRSTMSMTKSVVRGMFEDAMENDLIKKNPCRRIIIPQDKPYERRVLSVSEQKEFLQFCSGTMYDLLFQFALLTGLRVGELGGLMWSDIDQEKKLVYIQRALKYSKEGHGLYFGPPKTASSVRCVPLTDDALDVLKKIRMQQLKNKIASNNWCNEPEYADLVFTTKNGKPCYCGEINDSIKRVVNKINKHRKIDARMKGVENPELMMSFSIHSLRHTFATRAFESGMKAKVVQAILGHSKLSMTTDLYEHTLHDHLISEMNKFQTVKVS